MMKIQLENVSNKENSLDSSLFQNGRVKINVVGRFSGMAYRAMMPELITQEHNWVGVVNPRNQRSLLEACDDCGIVKSENSISRNCRAAPGQSVITGAQQLM
jgi:hypothetical protein